MNTYTLPALSCFKRGMPRPDITVRDTLGEDITRILLSYNVKGAVTSVQTGPLLTRVMFEPEAGTRSKRVIGLTQDLARHLRAKSALISQLPGEIALAIEIPHDEPQTVRLGDLLGSEEFAAYQADLPIVLGCSVTGEPMFADLAAMPHLLMAGSTGSGKSVGMHGIILSLMYRLTSHQVRMILIDPKMLEFQTYKGTPHVEVGVITDVGLAVSAFEMLVEEMEKRYRILSRKGVRDIKSFNERGRIDAALLGDEFTPMPRIVVAVDELADLMLVAGKQFESLVQRIAQKARAAGIHMILATQRPSTDVITGIIKANLPSRLSYAVASSIDSRCILGQMGAEHLIGRGDSLFMKGNIVERIHGALVTDDEIAAVTDMLKEQTQELTAS